MTIEEAQAKIKELTDALEAKDGKLAELQENAGKVSKEELEKIEQRAYNKGFDKAKNQFTEEKKGYVSKDEVEQLLSARDKAFKTQRELLKMGIKNPERAMKIIDEDDLAKFGTDDFKVDDFKSKYSDVLVFKAEDNTPPPSNKPFTKNNSTPATKKLTAEEYAEMSKEERAKLSNEERAELLKG